ncbi:MAG TPA: GNAT family N-acetyltransferase [Vicinamibacterales bacterium]|nr:GNAT family N-acetyltransferase [Vicinamibacterales bacterium]
MSTDDVDETVEESFPASDAPANTGETGIGHASTAGEGAVVDNPAMHRFVLNVDGRTAFLEYQRTSDTFTILHTEVPEAFRGHNFGGRLVEAAVASAHAAGLRLVVVCPFARAYLRKHQG